MIFQLDWSGYEGASILVSIALVIATAVFAGLVHRQIKHERTIFEIQKEELVTENKLETFNHIDKFLERLRSKYELTHDLCFNIPMNIPKGSTSDPALRERRNKIIELVVDIDNIALKQKELELDIRIIHRSVGGIIIGVYDSKYIQEMMKTYPAGNNFVILDEFIAKLRIEESEYKTMP